ncbi:MULTISPECIES: LysR family transcriptional regulator [Vibrio]|uniref:Putative LysR family transcriptional regulator n=1 Tax=Vibrio proteolyticus NBRC 13287 TaxID=1219065 RepID=U3A4H9_VIBPR|nr:MULTISPECIES: LysR family transcriptional regulator [Vibrio]NAW57705.1 LysR family transcriptional regulator [Vibrio sp. V36_P2S2PM302]NAX21164.1 LysR family transcriptional regulator [Vibrio sp. V39_P1S14PM300]NAX28323.1 LysR family transcriptional regulator [Vibrio sp. V38_P2S17PM301]NAX29066.1 LysR family transcriptional regulator [Vibrio sp. V37_P2S8PM304]GAD68242.1 putative LysR family transcriptional regulator [Vibrio proteolyticus NBRC 13287]
MDWIQGIDSFIKVVEEGSFNGAARRLNTTSSAISKRIHWLEERVGVQLLKRTTRSVTQTEAGALFYERAKDSIDRLQSIIDETRSVSQSPAGLLKIGATIAVGSKFLVQYLDDFLKQYPDIRIQLTTTAPGQIPEMSLDLFISRELEQFNSLSYKATPLFEQRIGFYASPSYITEYGVPTTIEELKQHKVLIWGERPQREFKFSKGKRTVLSGNFATTNPEALFYAAKNGMGILISNDVMIKEDVRSGALVRILPDVTTNDSTVYAYYPKLDYEHTRTKLFLNYLKMRLSQAG